MKRSMMLLFLGLTGLVGYMDAMEEILSKERVVVKLADGKKFRISEEQLDSFKDLLDGDFYDGFKESSYELPGLDKEGFKVIVDNLDTLKSDDPQVLRDFINTFYENGDSAALVILIEAADYLAMDRVLESIREFFQEKSLCEMIATNPAFVKAIFESYVAELLKFDLDGQDEFDRTALMWAAEKGHKEIVELLINAGADINKQHCRTPLLLGDEFDDSEDGPTALMLAAENGHKEIVELLIHAKADINKQSFDFDLRWPTALMLAVENGHKEIVELLINAGADINEQYLDLELRCHTALMWVAANGHKEILELLLEKGADVNWQNALGETALMWAAEDNHKGVVKMLIEAGADSSVIFNGRTALMIAREENHNDVVALLGKSKVGWKIFLMYWAILVGFCALAHEFDFI